MKKNKLAFSYMFLKLVLVSVLLLFFLGCKEKKVEELPKRPELKLKEEDYNFGYCQENEKVFHDFHFYNSGGDALQIEVKSSSCTCTTGQLDKNEYLPGEEGYIRILLDTKGRLGSMAGSVLLNTNDELNPLVVLTVKTTIRGANVNYKHIDFGEISRGQLSQKQLILESFGLDDFSVIKTETSNEAITLTEIEEEFTSHTNPSIDYTKKYTVSLCPSDLSLGSFSGKVILYTNNANYPKYEIRVSAQVQGDIIAMPSALNFGVMKPGMKINRSFRVQASNGETIMIKEVDGLPTGMTYGISPSSSSKDITLDMDFIAPDEIGLMKDTLVISVKRNGNNNILRIPYTILVWK